VDLLNGMYLMAVDNADRLLSPHGKEVRQMLATAAEELGVVEAYNLAEAVEDLPEKEIRALDAFMARLSLIMAMQESLGIRFFEEDTPTE
jgi:hypothetical protein